jgi:hypothetical protein
MNGPTWLDSQRTDVDYIDRVEKALSLAWDGLIDAERSFFCHDQMNPRDCSHCRVKKVMQVIEEIGSGRNQKSSTL